MNKYTVLNTRTLTLGALATAMVFLAGCMTKPVRPVNPDGTYCYRIGKSYRPKLTCTPGPIPSVSVEEDAKRFAGTAGALTVYVLRRSWNDASVVVPVKVDGADGAATIPESLVRLRLTTGKHKLSATWDGREVGISVEGLAGDVQMVELKGTGWAWGSTFSLQAVHLDDVRERAQVSKLVADADLSR